jgi:hypothetical protein
MISLGFHKIDTVFDMDSKSQMLHGAGIFTYIWVILVVNVGKYSNTMEHLGVIPKTLGGLT